MIPANLFRCLIASWLFLIHHFNSKGPTVNDFIYYNSGTTTKQQQYELFGINNIYNEGYQYKYDPLGSNEWSTGSPLTYLFERFQNGSLGTPSSGLRSSVFLGPIGQGGFEIRGDGRLTDFTIFNNGPNARPSPFARKWDLNEAVFGFNFETKSKTESKTQSSSFILQTSPLDSKMSRYAVDSLTYSGSYPVSHLVATDRTFPGLGIQTINLTAFSSFEPLNINMSSIPAVIFWFDIDTRGSTQSLNMKMFLNWPDIIDIDTHQTYTPSNGSNDINNGFSLNKTMRMETKGICTDTRCNGIAKLCCEGSTALQRKDWCIGALTCDSCCGWVDLQDPVYFAAGNMTFSVQECTSNSCDTPVNGTYFKGNSLYENWMQFLNESVVSEFENDHKSKSEFAERLKSENEQNAKTSKSTKTSKSRKSSKSTKSSPIPKVYGHYGWNSESIEIPPDSVHRFGIIFSWYFPLRTFNNNSQHLGHWYNQFYNSSEDVNQDIVTKIPDIIHNIASWHKLWNESDALMFPDFLKDTYLNGPGYISRTGYLLESGSWRQSESFSCFQIDPPHIHQYRSLAYNLIFGDILDRGTLNMYTFGETEDGLISELYGGSCGGISGTMGTPSGGARGDDNSLFILGMYSQFKWYRDGRQFVEKRYRFIKKAMQWIMDHSIPRGFGVPYRLVNTNDEHGIIGDINTYNSMIYLSALYAMKTMATYIEPQNSTYLRTLDKATDYANGNITKLLWRPGVKGICADTRCGGAAWECCEGSPALQHKDVCVGSVDCDSCCGWVEGNDGFYISFWCQNGSYATHGLQTDVLYGYLWSHILDLEEHWKVNTSHFISHLVEEKRRNWSPYGLQFMSNRSTPRFDCNSGALEGGFRDFDTWEMASIDHAATLLFLDRSQLKESMTVMQTALDKYRMLFHDQWDWRDTSSIYNDSDPEYSRPVVNSHYSRQLIHYSMLMALNGQKLNVDPKTGDLTLTVDPVVPWNGESKCLPVMIPQCSFLLCFDADRRCFTLDGLFGEVNFDILSIANPTFVTFRGIAVTKGLVTWICYSSA